MNNNPDNTTTDIEKLKLTDIVSADILQEFQDLFASISEMNLLLVDPDGKPITQPSLEDEFCSVANEGTPSCFEHPQKIGIDLRTIAEIEKHRCKHDVQMFFIPIRFENNPFGVVIAAAPCLREGAGKLPLSPFQPAASVPADIVIGKKNKSEVLDSMVGLLHYMFNTLVEVGFKGYKLGKNVKELTALLDITRLFNSTHELDDVLNIVVKTLTDRLDGKAGTLRLLDESTGSLEIKATYNLSEEYLNKGPVMTGASVIDQEAIKGKIIQVYDISQDPRILYPPEMMKEGLVSLVCTGLINKDKPLGVIRVYTGTPRRFTEGELEFFEAIANTAAVAIDNAILLAEEADRQKIEHELGLASRIQRQLFPKDNPHIEGFDIFGVSVPSSRVGGDFYDYIPVPQAHLGIAIGDALGKGFSAALIMATARAALRAQIENAYATNEIINRVNKSIARDNWSRQGGTFITLFYGALNTRQGRFTYTNAGHNPPVLFRNGTHSFLTTGGMVLGVEPDVQYDEKQIDLKKDDVIIFYTDGVVDAIGPDKENLGTDRFLDFAKTVVNYSAEEIYSRITGFLTGYSGSVTQEDDTTIVVLKVTKDFPSPK